MTIPKALEPNARGPMNLLCMSSEWRATRYFIPATAGLIAYQEQSVTTADDRRSSAPDPMRLAAYRQTIPSTL